MKATILIDNIGCGELTGEWGLSIHIEYGGKKFLLDTGASDSFLENARRLGIKIEEVDFAILSHAHYDHTNGLAAFLSANSKAPVFLSRAAEENCYAGLGFISKYIGIPKGVVGMQTDRIIRPEGVTEIYKGVYLVPHSTPGLSRIGRRNHLLVKHGYRYFPDDFSHEQTLVFKTGKGLVLMNSCSHAGPDVITDEVLKAFPGEHIAAYIGGLHLFRMSEQEVNAIADKLAACKIEHIYTGHCTGQKAFDILQTRFGDRIAQFKCGMSIGVGSDNI